MTDYTEIDGSHLEGGGQILRTTLALSTIMQKPVRITNIRKGRTKPGLKPQHALGVKAIRHLSNAETDGLIKGSTEITYAPKTIRTGTFKMNIGTAGAITLVLQTLMPVAPFLPGHLSMTITGGTDVPFSPPSEFVEHVLLPTLTKMGYRARLGIKARGYYPKGGGTIRFTSDPIKQLKAITLSKFGDIDYVKGVSHSSGMSNTVVQDQAQAAKYYLNKKGIEIVTIDEKATPATANQSKSAGITLWAKTTTGGLISSNGLMQGKEQSEKIGKDAAERLYRYLRPQKPVGPHLADQLIPYMGLAKGHSVIEVAEITKHTLTNIWVAEQMLGIHYYVKGDEGEPGTISVSGIGYQKP